eukprot:3032921-Ditylum_brightwellii.AAC.1
MLRRTLPLYPTVAAAAATSLSSFAAATMVVIIVVVMCLACNDDKELFYRGVKAEELLGTSLIILETIKA